MKVIFKFLLVVFVLTNQFTVYANSEFTFSELPADEEPLISKISTDVDISNKKFIGALGLSRSYINHVNGETYIVGRGNTSYSLPVKVPGDVVTGPDCVWTGEYYFTRSSALDGYWYDAEKYAVPLCLYDKNWNLIKQYDLKNTYKQHPLKIGYADGVFYCLLKEEWNNGTLESEKTICSTDFENWQETDQSVPQRFAQATLWGEKISFSNNEFLPVVYEDKTKKNIYYTLGEWIINIDSEGDFYFTNDNIYFYKIKYPDELKTIDDANNYSYSVKASYEYGDYVVIDMAKKWGNSTNSIGTVRLMVDKNEIYSQLNELQTKPKIEYQRRLLAFETAPVIEEGRILVPMRFLFEQMGADVEWNQETQTATATMNNTAVAFSINDTNAEVNGTAATMDVPARLINDKTMVPLRFLSEEMGYTVTWDEATRTAVIE